MSSNECRTVQAPEPKGQNLRNRFLNVNCAEGEDVEWLWTETAQGQYVSGYQIVPRTPTNYARASHIARVLKRDL